MADRHTKALLPLLASLALALLAGCSQDVAPLAPSMPSFPWVSGETAPDRSLVALTATIAGLECADGRLVLAREGEGGAYERAAVVKLSSSYAGRSSVGIAALDPGDYHVVSYACRNGGNVTFLGGSGIEGEIPWASGTYPASLASFRVERQETLIAGALRIDRKAGTGGLLNPADRAVTLAADGLTPAELATLAERRADLSGSPVARLMTLSPGPKKGFRLTKCVLVAEAGEAGATHAKARKQKGAGAVFASLVGPEEKPTACRKGKGASPELDRIVDGSE